MRIGVVVGAGCAIAAWRAFDEDDYAAPAPFHRDWSHSAGCSHFIVHARKAVLGGLSPRENREVPPLRL